MKLFLAFLLTMTLAFSAFAEGDHAEREDITGSGFVMAHVKEVLVGTVNNIPVWATKTCGDKIEGQYKKTADGEVEQFLVANVDRKLTGTFGEKVVQFAGLDRDNSTIMLKDGDQTINVKYETESFDGEHYHGITWKFNGKEIHLDGEGCLGSMIFYSLFFYGLSSL